MSTDKNGTKALTLYPNWDKWERAYSTVLWKRLRCCLGCVRSSWLRWANNRWNSLKDALMVWILRWLRCPAQRAPGADPANGQDVQLAVTKSPSAPLWGVLRTNKRCKKSRNLTVDLSLSFTITCISSLQLVVFHDVWNEILFLLIFDQGVNCGRLFASALFTGFKSLLRLTTRYVTRTLAINVTFWATFKGRSRKKSEKRTKILHRFIEDWRNIGFCLNVQTHLNTIYRQCLRKVQEARTQKPSRLEREKRTRRMRRKIGKLKPKKTRVGRTMTRWCWRNKTGCSSEWVEGNLPRKKLARWTLLC